MEWGAHRVLKDDDFTVVTWRQMLVDVGGMQETEFASFLSYWRGYVAGDDCDWFMHETEGYYAAYELIPAELRNTYRYGGCLIPLKNEIHSILDRYFHNQRFSSDQAPEVRTAIDNAVANWITTQSANAARVQERAKATLGCDQHP
jgi:hypothetical protein